MLRDSMTYAEEDVSARMLREQRVEADRVLDALNAALTQDAKLLSKEEHHSIDVAMQKLKTARDGSDPRAIKKMIDEADQASSEFAARRMDQSIKQALTGHTLDEFESGIK